MKCRKAGERPAIKDCTKNKPVLSTREYCAKSSGPNARGNIIKMKNAFTKDKL